MQLPCFDGCTSSAVLCQVLSVCLLVEKDANRLVIPKNDCGHTQKFGDCSLLPTYHQRNMLIVLRSINLPRQLDNLFGTEVLKIAAKEYRKVSILYSEEETRKIAYQAHDCKVKLRTITIAFDKCHLHLYFSPFSSYYDNLAKCYKLFMRKRLWMLADRAIQDHKSLNSENIICQIQIKYLLELARKH